MKYNCEIVIDADIKKVVKLFEDPNNMAKWQPGFISMEVLEGNAGEAGSRSKLLYLIEIVVSWKG